MTSDPHLTARQASITARGDSASTTKVLLIWPIEVPTYWNLCYHFAYLGELAEYLDRSSFVELRVVDGGALGMTWGDIVRELLWLPDVVVALNTFESLASLTRICQLTRSVVPEARIITLGRASSVVPRYFCDLPVDAVVLDGDWELVVHDYLGFVRGTLALSDLHGILLRRDEKWVSTAPGRLLNPLRWGFPALERLPLDDYQRATGERELAVTASRGCPWACRWCDVSYIYRTRDRRRSVSSLIDYLRPRVWNFDFVSFFSATFAADRAWVVDLCSGVCQSLAGLRWKCVTTVVSVDDDLLAAMAHAGCFRIGFGVETLESSAQQTLGKPVSEQQIQHVVATCRRLGIEPLCFLMLGVPGQTRDGVFETIEKIKSWGGLPRLTAFMPLHELQAGTGNSVLDRLDRKTLDVGAVDGLTGREFLQLMYSVPDRYPSCAGRQGGAEPGIGVAPDSCRPEA